MTTHQCARCKTPLEREDVFRRKVQFYNARSTKMACSYGLRGDYCISCARGEANANRRPRGRRPKEKAL